MSNLPPTQQQWFAEDARPEFCINDIVRCVQGIDEILTVGSLYQVIDLEQDVLVNGDYWVSVIDNHGKKRSVMADRFVLEAGSLGAQYGAEYDEIMQSEKIYDNLTADWRQRRAGHDRGLGEVMQSDASAAT